MPRASRRARRINDPAGGRQVASDARALRLWRRRLEGWLGFLEEMNAGNPKINPHWRAQMREHYTAQISNALDVVPLGGERSAKLFRDRLRSLLSDG